MTLPISGPMTAAMINLELGRAADTPFSIDDPQVRALAGIPSGMITFADFYGKPSNSTQYVITCGTDFLQLKIGYNVYPGNEYGSLAPTNLRGIPIESVVSDPGTTNPWGLAFAVIGYVPQDFFSTIAITGGLTYASAAANEYAQYPDLGGTTQWIFWGDPAFTFVGQQRILTISW